ncbi:hypothetical protein HQ560_18130 [bacterium]|nr:hypothetical protein [bacterium]
MANYWYYVNENAQQNGDHEVHEQGCKFMPKRENQLFLGEFPSCHGAVRTAKVFDPKANGCIHCCPACHTS